MLAGASSDCEILLHLDCKFSRVFFVSFFPSDDLEDMCSISVLWEFTFKNSIIRFYTFCNTNNLFLASPMKKIMTLVYSNFHLFASCKSYLLIFYFYLLLNTNHYFLESMFFKFINMFYQCFCLPLF